MELSEQPRSGANSKSRPLDRLTLTQARRIALAAQGFGERRPGAPSRRHVERMLGRLGLVQIDSVNVLVRAHYMPLFSRLGAYDAALLDRAAYGGKRRRLFEYWGHEASLIRLDPAPAPTLAHGPRGTRGGDLQLDRPVRRGSARLCERRAAAGGGARPAQRP